jgi:protein-S-isoprenylcysteine O-methyltransferase Ste14
VTDDDPYRLALLLGLLAMAAVALPYRIRSQSTGERLDRRQEGLVIFVALRTTGAVLFLMMLTFLAKPTWLRWTAFPAPDGLRWAGVAVCAAALLLLWATFHALGANLTDTVVTRTEHTLVTHGPFRFVRHPLYVAFALQVGGLSLLAANWLFLAVGGVGFALLVIRTRREEELLVARFGDAYRRYMDSTGGFLPRFESGKSS